MSTFYELPTFRIKRENIPKIESWAKDLGYSINYPCLGTEPFYTIENRTIYLKINTEDKIFIIYACKKDSLVLNSMREFIHSKEKLLEELVFLSLLP